MEPGSFHSIPPRYLWSIAEVTNLCKPVFSSVKHGCLKELMDAKGLGWGAAQQGGCQCPHEGGERDNLSPYAQARLLPPQRLWLSEKFL